MKLVICKKAPHIDEIMDDRHSGHPYMVQINTLRVLEAKGKDVGVELDAMVEKSDRLTIQNIINQVNGDVGWQGHYDYSTDPNDYEVIEVISPIHVQEILKIKKHIKIKDKVYSKWTKTHPDLTAKRAADVKSKKDKVKALKVKLKVTDEEWELITNG